MAKDSQLKLKSAVENKQVLHFIVMRYRYASSFPVAVERFHSFREVHSLQWHAHRHAVGQAFLDHFVRQVRFPLIPL